MKSADFFTHGQRFFLRGDYAQSIRNFTHALESGVAGEKVYLPLGLAYFKNMEFSKAIESLSQVLEETPTNDRVLFLRGMAFFNNDQLDQALNDFNLALRFNQRNASAYVARSLAMRAMSRFEEAEFDLKSAIDIGGVEVELFMREYCLTPRLHGLALTLFDAERSVWGRKLRNMQAQTIH